MSKERFDGIESKYRNTDVETNLKIFEKILHCKENDVDEHGNKLSSWCLRAKISMTTPNKCMRDPVIFRCNFTPHARHGNKYSAYPVYDLACPIVDSVEGVTHAMRSSEYSDRIPLYNWMLKSLDMRPVAIREFSRLNLVNTCLSKRRLTLLVDKNIVDGWTDPRFPTVKGILRRGLTVEALT